MRRSKLQKMIDRAETPSVMLQIGQAYLEGHVLRDKTAAEAWLTRVVDADDPRSSPRAMGLIARRILGLRQVLPEADIRDIKARLQTAQGSEREELEALLKQTE